MVNNEVVVVPQPPIPPEIFSAPRFMPPSVEPTEQPSSQSDDAAPAAAGAAAAKEVPTRSWLPRLRARRVQNASSKS